MKKYYTVAISLLMVFGIFSCSIDPRLEDNEEAQILDAPSMAQFIAGAYRETVDYRYMGRNYIIAGEVRGDNTYANGYSTRFLSTSRMDIQYTNESTFEVGFTFKQIHQPIALANIIIHSDIDKLFNNPANKTTDKADINHIMGEALTLRAMTHFDLVRLYGQLYLNPAIVPDLPSPRLGVSYKKEYKSNEGEASARGSINENKADIYADLDKAIIYFTEGENSSRSSNKTNLTRDAAYALISRIGVYFGEQDDYQRSKNAAEELIGKYTLTPASGYVSYWKQSTAGEESIFELAQNTNDNQRSEAIAQIYRGEYGDIVPFSTFIEDAKFDANDVRRSEEMIGHNIGNAALRNMGKYPSKGAELGSDNIKVIRYSEVVLNYSEALFKLQQESDALNYLNEVPAHRNANLYASPITLDKILEERRKELVFEGFRFFDLARAGKSIDSPDKNVAVPNPNPLPWGSFNYALPIPRGEIDANPLAVQNPGY